MSTKPGIQRALISTADKSGLVDFARALSSLNIEIIATGGTAALLKQQNIPIKDIADVTGTPEMLSGRVKTLHPKIHGGLLAQRGKDDIELAQHNIQLIDLLVVNLYPFAKTVANPTCSFSEAIEQIDIGGPTMLRAAAKNHRFVTVVTDITDYVSVLTEIEAHGDTTLETRQRLALKVFDHTAHYDAAIAAYLQQQFSSTNKNFFPAQLQLTFEKSMDLRYGENPQQKAAVYRDPNAPSSCLTQAKLLQGKPLSYNNLLDGDAALNCVRSLDPDKPACVIVKHGTPCGAAYGDNLQDAYQKALRTDAESAFGGIVAVNQTLDAKTATALIQQFVEVLLVPDITAEALAILAQKDLCRVLLCGYPKPYHALSLRSISGGLLLQEEDNTSLPPTLTIATELQPTAEQTADLLFAWQIVKYVKSNAIVYVKNSMTLGIGAGQTSRVFSSKIAIEKAQTAGLTLTNAVMASDAFFPFADSIEAAAKAGITAIIQPGGSKRDAEVIQAANDWHLVMVLTGTRHFRH